MRLSVIAPSFKISDQDYQKTLKLLADLGLPYALSTPLFEKGLCAASETKRWTDLKQSLTDSHSNVVWCLRGGYGALHLLPQLLKLKSPVDFKASSLVTMSDRDDGFKLLIGFSDITVIHYFLNQVWGWPSLHYRHLNSFIKDQSVKQGLKDFKKTLKALSVSDKQTFKGLKAFNEKAKKVKTIKAPIVGGNLITLQSMIGSGIPLPKNQILFLEEIDEPIYKIDRALTQLQQAGWLKGVKAIVLGSFTHHNLEVQKQTRVYLQKELEKLNVPVFGFLPCGHMEKQKPLFLGTVSQITKVGQGFILNNRTLRF